MAINLPSFTPIYYARVSTSEQKGSLPGQVLELERFGKAVGFPRAAKVFSEVASGAKADRKQFDNLMKFLKGVKNPEKYIVVIRDQTRWARDTRTSLNRLHELNELGVNLLIEQSNTIIGPDSPEDDYGEMVFEILSAVSTHAKKSEEFARAKGVTMAKERGVFEGAVKDVYPGIKRNPFQRVADALPALNSKAINQIQFNRDIGFGENTRWLRNQIKNMNEIIQEGGTELLADWLEVVETLRGLEKKKGIGRRNAKASQKSRKAKALHRVTVAYLREPWNWPNPIREGNPDAASGEFVGTGTIEDAIENFKKYQPKN